jgi:hypothetical protein
MVAATNSGFLLVHGVWTFIVFGRSWCLDVYSIWSFMVFGGS